jgi:DNA helicase II / ATP-dependent DNA helicase PcrA
MFAWGPNELNGEQADAVLAPGNVLLMACPGSGKTRTLTYKVAFELDKIGDSQGRVVAITYTHRAADEITERIESLGVNTERLWIGTIHAFCLEWIIRPYGIYHEHLAHGYRILDIHEREDILKELCAPFLSYRVSPYDCEFYFADNRLFAACQNPSKRQFVLQILDAYRQFLQENRLLDFEFMLLYASELIDKHSQIASILAKLFAFIAIDEYQDTKGIQYQIIASILRAGQKETKAFIVGDPNQAIYQSLGGYPIPVEELSQMTELEFSKMELVQNYRSSARIIGFFSNFRLEASAIKVSSRDRDFQSTVSFDRVLLKDELQTELIRLIRLNINSGILPHEICIIAPQWVHLASVTRHLAASLPEFQFDGPGMVPFARDQENIWFKISRIALTEASPGMYLRRMRWAAEIIDDLHHCGAHTAIVTPALLLKISNGIGIGKTEGLEYLRAYFEELCSHLNIEFRSLEKLASDYETFFSSSETRIKRMIKEGAAFMSDIASFRRVFQTKSGITVSTIHGVKGAEFDVVIAYALLEGMIPHFNDPNPQESASKLLYVIGSRARKHLHLISERGRLRWQGGPEYVPTAVLDACQFAYDAM